MTLLLAAVGATVAALFEATVTTYLRFGEVQPHLLLALGVVLTIAVGLETGLVWAFVGGLALDVLVQRPMGSTAFVLLLCMGGAAVLGRVLARLRPLAPILAAGVLSLVYSTVLLVVVGALRTPPPIADPLGAFLPGAIYDAVIAGLIGPLAISIRDRRLQAQRVDW